MARRRAGRRWSLLLGGALYLWAPAALAAPTAAMREAARHLMDEGRERTSKGDLARALEAYRSAHELMHVPTTGLAVARAHVALNQLVEARDIAGEAARMRAEEGEHAAFADARQKAKDLEADLAERVPKIRIVLRGGSPTAVTLDETELSRPLPTEPIPVNPGAHTIVATDSRGTQVRERVEVQERETKNVELTLAESGAITPAKKDTGDATPSSDSPEMVRSSFAKVLTYGGFGLAVVGLGVGTATGLMTYSSASSLQSQCESSICDPSAKSELGSALTLSTVSTISFVAAGVGLVAGIVGLTLPKTPARQTTVGWSKLSIGAGSAGFQGVF